MYLAIFLDLYSRKVVGWATSNRMEASLVTSAFVRVKVKRQPKAGLIVHTDQGSQYV